MKKTVYIAAALALVVLLFAVGQPDKKQKTTTNDYLTPVSSLQDAHGLAVDVQDSSKVWIASHTGLHLMKNDKELYVVGDGRDDYMGFSTHPTDSNTVFTSGHPNTGGNLGFQKSIDAGRTWQKVSDGLNGPVDFHSMSVDRTNPDLIYGVYRGSMQKSLNGGKTWEYVDSAPASVIQLVAGAKEGTVYAATNSGLEISQDQGKTWKSASSDLAGAVVVTLGVNVKDANELFSYGQKLGLAKSSDGGASWSKVSTPFSKEAVLYITLDPNSPTTVYVLTQSLAIYKSTDSGVSWSKVR